MSLILNNVDKKLVFKLSIKQIYVEVLLRKSSKKDLIWGQVVHFTINKIKTVREAEGRDVV